MDEPTPSRRTQIIRAALRRYRTHTISGTTLRDVAQAAEMPLGNLYYYVKSRDDLVLEVLDECERELSALLKCWAVLPPVDWLRAITIDHRGYGQSVAPASVPGDLQTYAADALGVMDQLGVSKAIIGGTSMGGPIAFEMWRTAPERFTGLILINTIANPAGIVEQNIWKGMAQKASTFGPQSLAPELLKDMLTGQTRLNRPADAAFLTGIVKQASVAADVAGASVLATRPDSVPTLKTITVPTLILEGVEDTVYPPDFSLKIKQNVPGSQLVLIPGAAHAAIFEKASAANRAIIDWGRANGLR